MTNGSVLAEKTYRRRVLSGGLRGQRLRNELAQLLQGKQTLSRLYASNAFLLWHMAHAPRIDDRRMALEIAQQYDAQVLTRMEGSLGELFWQNRIQPVPHTPVAMSVRESDSGWRSRLFPEATIRWKDTFFHLKEHDPSLLRRALRALGAGSSAESFQEAGLRIRGGADGVFRQIPGMTLIMEDRVPSYPAFFVAEDTMGEFDSARKALMYRNRCFVFSQENRELDLMSLDTMELVNIAAVEGFPEEVAVSFTTCVRLGRKHLNALFFLFIKHSLPIGYGAANRINAPGRPCNIWVHVFPEYRGTPSSSNLFNLLLAETDRRFKPGSFVISRNPDTDGVSAVVISAEEEAAASLRFYERHGFRRVGANGLVFVKVVEGNLR